MWKTVVLAIVLVALAFETRAAYALAYVCIALFYILRRLQQSATAKLEIQREVDTTYLFPGDQAEIKIRLQNRSWLPLAWVSGHDQTPSVLDSGKPRKWVVSLPPKETSLISYPIYARKRGVYRLGPLSTAIGDFFGISTNILQVDKYQTVVVYPVVLPLDKLSIPSPLPFGNIKAQKRIYPDPSRLAGVRPYEPGDPLRTIHWKATARMKQLQVKQFDHTVTINTMIFLDMDERDYDVHSFYTDTESAVEIAASLAAHLVNTGEAVGLISNASWEEQSGVLRVPGRKGYAHLTEVLTSLAGVDCQSSHSFIELLSEEGRKLSAGTILLLVVPLDTVEIVQKAISFVKMGYFVFIFVVGKSIIHKNLMQSSSSAPLQVFRVRSL